MGLFLSMLSRKIWGEVTLDPFCQCLKKSELLACRSDNSCSCIPSAPSHPPPCPAGLKTLGVIWTWETTKGQSQSQTQAPSVALRPPSKPPHC